MGNSAEWRSEADAMRRALPQTWYPFFARFPRPQPVQLLSWQVLRAGRDAVLCSPTASGKTEAVIAPLVENYLDPASKTLPRLLLVSPTRALVNDLKRRLEEPFARLGLKIERRTGDHAQLDRKRPPQALVTTPESLDSLMVRHLDFLKELRGIMLDELHILDGTARGDQLRLLLHRLRATIGKRNGRLQVIATSATIHDPKGLAERYLEDAYQVITGESKAIEGQFVECSGPNKLLALLDRSWGPNGGRYRKILVFVASRRDVEQLASLASGHPRLSSRVLAHHGSLSRNERERVEKRFSDDPSAICFATMTLELGIDIGDIDLVVIAAVPSSVASLIQRIGRGGRRRKNSRMIACYRDPGELSRLKHLFELIRRGDFCPEPYVFKPSILVQQAGSLLLQSRKKWLSSRVFKDRLPGDVASEYNAGLLEELLLDLSSNEWLAPGRSGRFVAGERLLRAFERGEIHGNLGWEPVTVEVVDNSTGRSLGHVARDTEGGDRLVVAGRSREVLRRSETQIWVRDGIQSDQTRFAPRGRQTISREVARSLAEFIGIENGSLPIVEIPGGLAILHFQGSLGGEILARCLRTKHQWPIVHGRTLAIVVRSLVSDEPAPIDSESLSGEIAPLRKRLGSLAGAGRYYRDLPRSWQLRYLKRVIPCEQIARDWSQSRFVEAADDEQREILLALATVS